MVAPKPDQPRSTRRHPARPRTPFINRVLVRTARLLTSLIGRIDVSGSLPDALRGRPILLAANHIGVYDTAVLLVACHRVGIVPRIVTNGGLFDTPIVGPLLRRAGHLRVDPAAAGCAVRGTALLPELATGDPVLIYPEGRLSRDPDLWPDRGQTGLARLALATGQPVVPISQWGAHAVIPAGTPPVRNPLGVLRLAWICLGSMRPSRRHTFKVHFGDPVDLTGLRSGRPGDANRAHARIMLAITAGLVPLRADDPAPPSQTDPTRSVGRPSPWRPQP